MWSELRSAKLLANALKLNIPKENIPADRAFELIILESVGRKAAKTALDWKKNIADYIVACRQDGGLPFFRLTYAGQPLVTSDGRRVVLGLCWGGKGAVEGQYFVNVPEEDLERMERELGDWRWLIRKYGDPKQVRMAFEAPVIL